ncbi:S1C family serine protease [Frigoriglobus tundricola]|uniref:Uncharacterized protein n=1 Tax=Frigoriglobus tundricola TaxID=2774151 RepID=A0A6M5Z3V7_9BACT|nr:S1C family serine protease [Frigoriglobus tundricola]QJX00201.1 hypothetical protein FTUN_7825 [Frigoriglobus tundricola]
MRRSLALFAGIIGLVSSARSEDGIPPDTVTAVKRATVFVQVVRPEGAGSGSGFVISVSKDAVLIATNYHVIGPDDFDKKPRLPPAEFVKSLKVPAVTVVFDSGMKTEWSAKAEVIAGDPVNDLAVLRVTGVKNPPKPIEYATPPKLVETMQVYSFGFPFGQALATGKGSPAVTVGKATVSSLRLDDDGELNTVQLDGAINPGNSGGPVVDTKGRLVGVAVATVRGAGIGFAVPAPELGKMMKGRLDGFRMTGTKTADNKLALKAEVGVLDPTGGVRGGALHYVIVPPKGNKPKAGEAIAKMAGARSVPLKVSGGVATGELTLDKAEGDLYVQAVPEGGAGAAGTSRVGNYALTLPKAAGAVVLGPAGTVAPGAGAGEVPPPNGWKEHVAGNKTFICWVPVKVKSQNERSRTSTRGQMRMSHTTLVIDVGPADPTYVIEQITITTVPRRALDQAELTPVLRELILNEVPGGKLTRELDTTMGRFPGKEYLVEKGGGGLRARAFVIGNGLYIIQAMGTRAQLEGAEGTTFLDSVRLQARPPAGGAGAIAGGGGGDPQFRDAVPLGATLVGLEISVAKAAPNAVKGVRAVFLAGDKETYGEWRGAAPSADTETVKLVAKPDYAVGSINARTTPVIHGLSVTFMKVADGKLDPKDTYESEWVGPKDGVGQGPITVGGRGDLALGFIGRTNGTTLTGVGLLYPDTAKKGPDAVAGGPGATGTGTAPQMVGGRTDPEFRDPAPPGGTLIGLEVGVGRLGPNSSVKAVRGVFRVGEKETLGAWHGPSGDDVITERVRLVARPGYAVGALNVRTGPGVYGLSVTFMKEANGKLEPADAYESDWAGAAIGLGPLKVGGTGELARGVSGRKAATTLSAVGLVFGDVGRLEPAPPSAPAPGAMVGDKPAADVGIAAAPPAAVRPGERGPRIQGGGGDPEVRDHAPADGVLVGFHVGLGKFINNDTIKALRPIYRVGDKDSNGVPFGTNPVGLVKVLAKPGYAVGAITVKTGLGIDGMSVTFMKLVDGKLDPTDAYESAWIGGMGGGGPAKIGDGSLVVGVLIKGRGDTVNGVGLIYTDTNKPGLDGAWPAGRPTAIQGGGGDTEFREVGPEGSLLVGLEVGVGRFFDNPVVSTLRPIFRVDDKDTEGEWHGMPKEGTVKETVRVVAKPGYAVAAITAKTGLGMDGLSVTFMKVVDGKFDPRSSYESEWVGGKGGGGPVTIRTDGPLVIGLIGKARADTVSGVGLLLFQAPKKK